MFTTANESEFLNEVKTYIENSEWKECDINTIKLDSGCNNIGISKDEQFKITDINAGGNLQINCEIMNSCEIIPLAEMSIKSLTERAGIKGPALSALKKQDFIKVVNKCTAVGKGKAKLFTVNDMVFAAHSDNYVVLDMDSIFNSAVQKMKKVYPKANFSKGYIDHCVAMCEYDLALHTEIMDEYNRLLRQMTQNSGRISADWNVTPLVRFISSNTGFSGANIYPYFNRSGIVFPVGKPIVLEHRGSASLEKYNESLDMMYSAAKKAYADFAKLKTIVIKHPRKCMQNIAQRVGLPKRFSMQAASEYELFAGNEYSNAFDLYMALTDVLSYAKENGKFAENGMLAIQESLARVLTLDFTAYDLPSSAWDENRLAA